MLLSATGAVCHCHTEPTANAASPAVRTGDADLPYRVTLWTIFLQYVVVEDTFIYSALRIFIHQANMVDNKQ